MMGKGKVYLVGAGPGDEGLITLRGAEVLAGAECVIYDGLVNPAILRHAPVGAELIPVRKRTGSNPVCQETVSGLIAEKAGRGMTVVRLKGGDPCIFGRAAEEVAVCVEKGIEFEIVPGITAGIAAAAYTGIFLSDREHSSQVVFVTGHEAVGKNKSAIDFEFLAKFGGSIVFYMAMGNLEAIVKELIEKGKNADTPVAIVSDATLPSQKLLTAKLSDVVEKYRERGIEAPAIVIIGQAAGSNPAYNWFMKKPLFGQSVIITRDAAGNQELAAKLVRMGAKPVRFDSIELLSLVDEPAGGKVPAAIDGYDWVVFTSANGVEFTLNAIERTGKDARFFGKARVACIGPRTAERLRRFGIRADFVPAVFTTKRLVEELADFTDLKGRRILLLRSAIGDRLLTMAMEEAGAEVDDVGVYTVRPAEQAPEGLIARITSGAIDWVMFTSPSTADAFFGKISPDILRAGAVKTASIGPVTTARLRELGIRVDVEAKVQTIDGLLKAITSDLYPSG